jgi:hypothetical protein
VALILIQGQPVGFHHRLQAGDRVEIHPVGPWPLPTTGPPPRPPPRPPPPPPPAPPTGFCVRIVCRHRGCSIDLIPMCSGVG